MENKIGNVSRDKGKEAPDVAMWLASVVVYLHTGRGRPLFESAVVVSACHRLELILPPEPSALFPFPPLIAFTLCLFPAHRDYLQHSSTFLRCREPEQRSKPSQAAQYLPPNAQPLHPRWRPRSLLYGAPRLQCQLSRLLHLGRPTNASAVHARASPIRRPRRKRTTRYLSWIQMERTSEVAVDPSAMVAHSSWVTRSGECSLSTPSRKS